MNNYRHKLGLGFDLQNRVEILVPLDHPIHGPLGTVLSKEDWTFANYNPDLIIVKSDNGDDYQFESKDLRKLVAHIPTEHKDKTCEYGCMICDGGLFLCTQCGCLEGSLPTECPETNSYTEYGDRIYKGEIDFFRGHWISKVSSNSPRFYNSRGV